MVGRKVYLICQYTHSDPLIREERFAIATCMAAELLNQGVFVFLSPHARASDDPNRKAVCLENYPSTREYDKAVHDAFYQELPEVIDKVLSLFETYELDQAQAACAVACVLNRMVTIDGKEPHIARISLSSAFLRTDN